MQAKLSILGLYKFDTTIFDEMSLPEQLDKTILINAIIADCAEFPIVYPDPDIFKALIKTWSIQKLPTWEKLYNTTVLDYNPIENYDRNEELTENDTGTATQTPNTPTTESATGYNSETLQTTGASVTTGNNTTTTESTVKHINRIHGNIGVTTSQAMITAEREIDSFEIYSAIVADFKDSFCVQVY